MEENRRRGTGYRRGGGEGTSGGFPSTGSDRTVRVDRRFRLRVSLLQIIIVVPPKRIKLVYFGARTSRVKGWSLSFGENWWMGWFFFFFNGVFFYVGFGLLNRSYACSYYKVFLMIFKRFRLSVDVIY